MNTNRIELDAILAINIHDKNVPITLLFHFNKYFTIITNYYY